VQKDLYKFTNTIALIILFILDFAQCWYIIYPELGTLLHISNALIPLPLLFVKSNSLPLLVTNFKK